MANSETYFVISKIGHFVGCFILGLLLFNWLGLKKLTLVFILVLVTLVEISQGFFTRDARFLDVIINVSGVTFAIFVYCWKRK
ncbi:VanZ family protein [Anaerobacillus sp. MEB173]|uniref:VanZ family protein n=1 Tax=Anaerobacillus sp. MEB173 TaxID=3383345 RepID=UPI003F903C3A